MATGSFDVGRYLRDGLSSMFQQKICTDFEVEVGGKIFHCHKVVLAAVSDYFRAMFECSMKETLENRCVFNDIEPEVFQNILELIYDENEEKLNDIMKNSMSVMEEYLRVSGMLQMKCLQDFCLRHIQGSLCSQNGIEFWQMGKMLQIDELQELGLNYVLKHFEEIVKLELFANLEYSEFKTLIENEDLFVAKEETVCNAVLSWVSFEDSREEKLPALLKCCSLSQLEIKYLASHLSSHPLCKKNEEALKIIERAVQFQLNKGQHGNSMFLRKCTPLEQLPLVMAGKANEETLTDILFMGKSKIKYSWVKPSSRLPLGKDFACCVYGTSICFTGGTLGKKRNLMYDHSLLLWTYYKDMPAAVYKHSMTANNKSVYVVGGCCPGAETIMNDSIFVYSIEEDTWETLVHSESMDIIPVKKPSSICLDNKIYIIGGLSVTDEATDIVQVFDIEIKTCQMFCHLPKPCKFVKAVCDTTNIFVINDKGDIFKFNDESTDVVSFITSEGFKLSDFGVVLHNDILHIYSGMSTDDPSEARRKLITVPVYRARLETVNMETLNMAVNMATVNMATVNKATEKTGPLLQLHQIQEFTVFEALLFVVRTI